MSKALVKKEKGTGIVPAVASGFVPGLGQLINGEGDKALGVFAVATVAGLSIIGVIPLIGSVAGVVGGATWVYGVLDGWWTGRKKGRP